MAREKTWEERTATDCRNRAEKRWGHGWALLSSDQREAFLALEVLKVLLVQDEGHADPQVRKLQEVARLTLSEEPTVKV